MSASRSDRNSISVRIPLHYEKISPAKPLKDDDEHKYGDFLARLAKASYIAAAYASAPKTTNSCEALLFLELLHKLLSHEEAFHVKCRTVFSPPSIELPFLRTLNSPRHVSTRAGSVISAKCLANWNCISLMSSARGWREIYAANEAHKTSRQIIVKFFRSLSHLVNRQLARCVFKFK